ARGNRGGGRREGGDARGGCGAMSVLEVTLIGGGMIAHDQLLPSLYHLQRQGVIGQISVCAAHGRTLKALAEGGALRRAFPGQSFRAFPDLFGDLDRSHPDLFREVITRMPAHNIVVVAVPDQLHYDVVMTALRHEQHVCAVKPLVLTAQESLEIEKEAYARGLAVGIEYHKRFDDRSRLGATPQPRRPFRS